MLSILDIGIDNALAIEISGKITEADMVAALNEVRDKVVKYDNIVVYEKIDSFEGIELAAIVEKFKYVFEEGLSNITKVAILTDKGWVDNVVSLEDKLFHAIELRSFKLHQHDEAVEFLRQ